MINDIEYDIFTNISEIIPVSFEAGKLKQIERRQSYQSGCRVFVNGKVGFSSTTNREDSRLLERARASAEFGREMTLELPAQMEYPELIQYYKKTADIKTEEMVEIGVVILRKLTDFIKSPDVKMNVEIRKVISQYELKNSKGLDNSYNKSLLSLSLFITHSKEGDILWLFDEFSSYKIDDIDIDEMVNRIFFWYEKCQNTGELKTGKYPVIFTPYALPQFLYPFTHCINGENIEKGVSILRDKKGERIFSDLITIIDDQTDERGINSRPFDGEGIPSRTLTLIENGILKSYIHTLSTAMKTRDEPTASAHRDGSNQPKPSITNLRIRGGDVSIDDMMKEIERGAIVYFLSGIGQSNTLAGEFQNGVYLGFIIEDGQITKRLKNVMLSGNIFEVMKDVRAVSKETEFVFGSAYIPYIKIDNISISGE
ncbi:MAG: TldD/PmbA family protein [bacterium]